MCGGHPLWGKWLNEWLPPCRRDEDAGEDESPIPSLLVVDATAEETGLAVVHEMESPSVGLLLAFGEDDGVLYGSNSAGGLWAWRRETDGALVPETTPRLTQLRDAARTVEESRKEPADGEPEGGSRASKRRRAGGH